MGILKYNNNNKLLWPQNSLTSELMSNMFSDFDHLVEGLLQPYTISNNNIASKCDINETKTHFLISFDMPGVKSEDINVSINANQLTVSGERHYPGHEGSENSKKFTTSSKFQRSFTLPSLIDNKNIEAHYDCGVLSIAIPKPEESKGHSIEVQTGKNNFLGKMLNSKKKNNIKEVNTR